jgi:hypothetical protein
VDESFAPEFMRQALRLFTDLQLRRMLDTPNIVLQPTYSRRIRSLFDTMVAESLMNRKPAGRIPVLGLDRRDMNPHALKVVG